MHLGKADTSAGLERERLIGGVVVCLHLRADHCEFTAQPLAGVVPTNAVKNAVTKWIVGELEYVEIYADPLDVADALWADTRPQPISSEDSFSCD